jgi:glucose-6-phosphate isomerase
MLPTALQLGKAPITLDWSGLQLYSNIDHSEWEATRGKLHQLFDSAKVGFFDAPIQEELSQISACIQLMEQLNTKKFTDCILIGIGGSALGPYFLYKSLFYIENKGINLHFLDNPDPQLWHNTIQALRPQTTLVCAMSKSGKTFETVTLALLALKWIGEERLKTHWVSITDPESGDLRAFSQYYQTHTLSIHPSIGGRFSIFSPVGLFPLLLLGHNPKHFLEGAGLVRDYILKTPVSRNPFYLLAYYFITQFKQKPLHVCLPYCSSLKTFADWFVQLWAESLGKATKGFTPISGCGAIDQHSTLQLFMDGPNDKIFTFITIQKWINDSITPRMSDILQKPPELKMFQMLEKVSLSQLLNIEFQATATALTKLAKPNWRVQIDTLDEKNLGALSFFYAYLTAVTGCMWDINPFDQPGVESTKELIQAALKPT